MSRLVLVLALCLVHLQPLTAAVLCEHHHAAATHGCGEATSHHEMATSPHGDHSAADECAATQACAPTAPAVVSVIVPLGQVGPSIAAAVRAPVENPESALAASPFHPPKV